MAPGQYVHSLANQTYKINMLSFLIMVDDFKFLYAYTKGKREYSSIITSIYFFPEVVGSGPLKSRLILSNGLVVLIKLKLSFGFKNLTLTSSSIEAGGKN